MCYNVINEFKTISFYIQIAFKEKAMKLNGIDLREFHPKLGNLKMAMRDGDLKCVALVIGTRVYKDKTQLNSDILCLFSDLICEVILTHEEGVNRHIQTEAQRLGIKVRFIPINDAGKNEKDFSDQYRYAVDEADCVFLVSDSFADHDTEAFFHASNTCKKVISCDAYKTAY